MASSGIAFNNGWTMLVKTSRSTIVGDNSVISKGLEVGDPLEIKGVDLGCGIFICHSRSCVSSMFLSKLIITIPVIRLCVGSNSNG